jgi:uncharacterized membrane protein
MIANSVANFHEALWKRAAAEKRLFNARPKPHSNAFPQRCLTYVNIVFEA